MTILDLMRLLVKYAITILHSSIYLDTFPSREVQSTYRFREFTKIYQANNSFKFMAETKIFFTMGHLRV